MLQADLPIEGVRRAYSRLRSKQSRWMSSPYDAARSRLLSVKDLRSINVDRTESPNTIGSTYHGFWHVGVSINSVQTRTSQNTSYRFVLDRSLPYIERYQKRCSFIPVLDDPKTHPDARCRANRAGRSGGRQASSIVVLTHFGLLRMQV
jgi:hypothetical protein